MELKHAREYKMPHIREQNNVNYSSYTKWKFYKFTELNVFCIGFQKVYNTDNTHGRYYE